MIGGHKLAASVAYLCDAVKYYSRGEFDLGAEKLQRAQEFVLEAIPAVGACEWCGTVHSERKCPLIRAVTYYPDGKVRRIEFHAPMQIPIGPVDISRVSAGGGTSEEPHG